MAENSKIEWTDTTWNVILGCDRVSPGCDTCYAIPQARIRAANPHPKVAAAFAGLTDYVDGRLDWTGRVNLLPDRLRQPLGWRKPRRVFVNSLADMFHDAVPVEFIAKVWAVMAATPQHTYQLLTKRHGRMRSLLNSKEFAELLAGEMAALWEVERVAPLRGPLPNVWLGVSVEDQKRANLRIPALLDTPAAVRWLSCEPLLGPVDLTRISRPSGQQPEMVLDVLGQRYGVPGRWQAPTSHRVDWVVCGGESGAKARPMHPDWARSLRDQCQAAGVPYFFKQFGKYSPYIPLVADPSRPGGQAPDWDRRAVWVDAVTGKTVNDEADVPETGSWQAMYRVGKKAAGRRLDGETWDQFPQPVGASS